MSITNHYAERLRMHSALAEAIQKAVTEYHDTPFSDTDKGESYGQAYARVLRAVSALRQAADDAAMDRCLDRSAS